MIQFLQLALFLLVGAGLTWSLYLLIRRRPPQVEGSAESLVMARQALNTLQSNLLPADIVGRIFARQDYEYVVRENPRVAQDLFLKERGKIAVSWVDQIRRQILSLKEFHLGSARLYARLDFATELRLAVEFAVLLWTCRALRVLLYLRGPYAAPQIVGTMAATATRVCEISERSLAFLKQPPLSRLGGNLPGDQATL